MTHKDLFTTYDIALAKQAFSSGLAVFATHPNDPDDPLLSLGEIDGAEDHLFAIKDTARTA